MFFLASTVYFPTDQHTVFRIHHQAPRAVILEPYVATTHALPMFAFLRFHFGILFDLLCLETRHWGSSQVHVIGNEFAHISAGPRHLERLGELFAVGPICNPRGLCSVRGEQCHVPFFPTMLRRLRGEDVYLVLSSHRFAYVPSRGFPT